MNRYAIRETRQTIFSVIKRRFGSEIKSYNDAIKEKEMLYRVLACSCHRMYVISAIVWMISGKPFEIFVLFPYLTNEQRKIPNTHLI